MSKTVAIIALVVIVALLVIAFLVGATRVKRALQQEDYAFASKILDVIKSIAFACVVLAGGSVAGASLVGCAAKRSITVQGTVVQSVSGDSTRVIISSQESYTGTKK